MLQEQHRGTPQRLAGGPPGEKHCAMECSPSRKLIAGFNESCNELHLLQEKCSATQTTPSCTNCRRCSQWSTSKEHYVIRNSPFADHTIRSKIRWVTMFGSKCHLPKCQGLGLACYREELSIKVWFRSKLQADSDAGVQFIPISTQQHNFYHLLNSAFSNQPFPKPRLSSLDVFMLQLFTHTAD